MSGILDFLQNPQLWNAVGAFGEGLQSIGQNRPADMRMYQAQANRIAQQQKLDALKGQIFNGNLNMSPQQQQLLENVYDAAPQAAIGQVMSSAFPSAQEMTDQQRLFQMIEPKNRQSAARVQLGLDPRAQAPDQPKPMSPVAKLTADFRAGRISREDFLRAREKALQSNNGITIGADGSMQIGGPVRKLSEQQSKFALFGSMMETTIPIINELEERFNPANFVDNAAGQLGWAGNWAESPEYQKYEAAGMAWAEGVLRLQTGAAAPEPEIVRVFKTYFAQPGNDPETIAFKRELRQAYLNNIGVASGGLVGGGQPSAEQSANPIDGASDDVLRELLGQ